MLASMRVHSNLNSLGTAVFYLFKHIFPLQHYIGTIFWHEYTFLIQLQSFLLISLDFRCAYNIIKIIL